MLPLYTTTQEDLASEFGLKVVDVIDPQGTYFGERLVARDDYPEDENNKSLYRLFPGGISMALILDDNPTVWQGEQFRHLLPLSPYYYFGTDKDSMRAVEEQVPWT